MISPALLRKGAGSIDHRKLNRADPTPPYLVPKALRLPPVPYAPERGRLVFLDSQAKGTVETINVTLASPVSLAIYALWISEDMNTGGARSTREFKLFAGATLLDDVSLLDTTGSQSFTSVYGGNGLEISDTLTSAPTTSSYTLQFIQNQTASGLSGLRAEEFVAYTPEPGTLSLVGIGILGLLFRRRSSRQID